MKLYEYQEKAVNKLFRRVEFGLENEEMAKEVLKAPTGSGKTVMLSSLINELSDLD